MNRERPEGMPKVRRKRVMLTGAAAFEPQRDTFSGVRTHDGAGELFQPRPFFLMEGQADEDG